MQAGLQLSEILPKANYRHVGLCGAQSNQYLKKTIQRTFLAIYVPLPRPPATQRTRVALQMAGHTLPAAEVAQRPPRSLLPLPPLYGTPKQVCRTYVQGNRRQCLGD